MHSDKQNSSILPSGCLWNSFKEKNLKLLSNFELSSLVTFDVHVDFMSENQHWKASYIRIFLTSFHTTSVDKFYHGTRKMYFIHWI